MYISLKSQIVMVNKIKNNIKNLNLKFIFLVTTTYLTTFITDLFYFSPASPDFPKYSIYFDYFSGKVDVTSLEQNLSYYFLQSLNLFFKNEYLYEYNFEIILDSSIVMVNNILYFIGIFGVYKLLTYFNFSKQNIYFSLILLNFFPPMLGSRLIYKPEILIFAILPWALYSFEAYNKTKVNLYLFSGSIQSIFLFTIKPTSTAMIGLFLVYRFRKLLRLEFKKIFFFYIFILFISSPMFFEDYEANRKFYLDHPNESVYKDQAPISFIYNINLPELISKPYKDYHADSLIGITLLDTFGDYFHLLWENDASLLKYNEVRYSNNFFINNYLEKYLGIVLTCLFYLSIVIYSIKDRKIKDYLLLPFFGIMTLLVVSYSGNFQLQTGDVLKTHYYSFLLGISFCFLIAKIFEKISIKLKILISVIFILFSLNIIGFPKIETDGYSDYLLQNNVSKIYCNLNNYLIEGESRECNQKVEYVCDFNLTNKDVNYIRSQSKYVNLESSYIYNSELPLLVKGNNKLVALTSESCKKLINKGYAPIKKGYVISVFPIFNILVLIVNCIIILILQFKKT